MRRWAEASWLRLVLIAGFAAGIVLAASGLKSLTGWADRGTIVATAAVDVGGSPPWVLDLEVPDSTVTYLLESTVVVAAPRDRRTTLTAQPTVHVTSPTDARVDHEVEPASQGASIRRGDQVHLRTYWWFRPAEAGAYRLTMVTLGLQPVGARPSSWRLRLARDVPEAPSGRALVAIGFALAALAFLLFVASAGATSGHEPSLPYSAAGPSKTR